MRFYNRSTFRVIPGSTRRRFCSAYPLLSSLWPFEFLLLLFGFTNAVATFLTYVIEVLKEYVDSFVVNYLDDALVYSKKEQKQFQQVGFVLKKLRRENLYANPPRQIFGADSVEKLSHRFTSDGASAGPYRSKVFCERPTAETKVEAQSFLGSASYRRSYV